MVSSLVQCLHLNTRPLPGRLLPRREPSAFDICLRQSSSRKSGGVPSALLPLASSPPPRQVVPGSREADSRREVLWGSLYSGVLNALGVFTQNHCRIKDSSLRGAEVLPHTPSPSPGSDSREDEVRGSLCLIVIPELPIANVVAELLECPPFLSSDSVSYPGLTWPEAPPSVNLRLHLLNSRPSITTFRFLRPLLATSAGSLPSLTTGAGSVGSLSSGVKWFPQFSLRVHILAPVFLINYFLDDATSLPISMHLPPLCDSHTD